MAESMEIDLPSSSKSIKLTGRLTVQEKPFIAIISHPYSLLGGNNRNHVVCFLERIFLNRGISTLCVNMRGAGRSEGRTSWTCTPEKDDLVALSLFATELLERKGIPNPKIILVGYSFGSVVSCYAAPEIPNLAGLLSISYPASLLWALTAFKTQPIYSAFEDITKSSIPKLFIIGDQDNFSSVAAWKTLVSFVPANPTQNTSTSEFIILSDLDHFYASEASLEMLTSPVRSFLDVLS